MAEEAFLEKRLQVCGTKQLARVWLSDFSCSKVIRTSPHIHSQEGEGEQQEASPQKGVPTLYLGGEKFDSQISPAAIVPHDDKVLWVTKKLLRGTPLV